LIIFHAILATINAQTIITGQIEGQYPSQLFDPLNASRGANGHASHHIGLKAKALTRPHHRVGVGGAKHGEYHLLGQGGQGGPGP